MFSHSWGRMGQLCLGVGRFFVAVVSFAFLAYAVFRASEPLKVLFKEPTFTHIAVVFCTAVFSMLWIAWVWVLLVRKLGGVLGGTYGVCAYFVGETTKYLPGALWPVLGRGELIAKAGVPRSIGYPSVLWSLLLNYIMAAAVAASILAPFVVFAVDSDKVNLLLLLVLPVGAFFLQPSLVNYFSELAQRFSKRKFVLPSLSWRHSVSTLALYVPAWFAIAATHVLIAEMFGVGLPFIQVAFAAIVAWLAGFLVVPAPSGIGVREVVFAGSFGPGVSTDELFAIAIVARAVFVLVDALGGVLGLIGLSRFALTKNSM